MSAARRHGPVGVALVGAGNISHQYLETMTRLPDLKVLAVTDLDERLAAERAAEYGVPRSGPVPAALEDPDVEIVVNLTPPSAHVPVSLGAVAAGRHVWVEKPLALDLASGRRLLDAAREAGVRVGVAPDTVLGVGSQTARRLIDEGRIGRPVSALTIMQSPGPESWHPSPEFFYDTGAGPLFDIGPYYLTTLVLMLGPVTRVSAVGNRARERRVVGSGPRAGQEFPVRVPTHVGALLEFASGAVATSILSFDSPVRRTGFVEVTGTDATVAVPDPNNFTGEVRVCAHGSEEWESIPAHKPDTGRGTGVLEMARALRAGRDHRAGGELALHVLDVMVAVDTAITQGASVELTTTVTAPEPLPADWDPYTPRL